MIMNMSHIQTSLSAEERFLSRSLDSESGADDTELLGGAKKSENINDGTRMEEDDVGELVVSFEMQTPDDSFPGEDLNDGEISVSFEISGDKQGCCTDVSEFVHTPLKLDLFVILFY